MYIARGNLVKNSADTCKSAAVSFVRTDEKGGQISRISIPITLASLTDGRCTAQSGANCTCIDCQCEMVTTLARGGRGGMATASDKTHSQNDLL